MPLLCAIAIVRPEMKVIRGDSSVLLPGSSLHSARASKNHNLILFRTILHPPDSFVSKNEGMAEDLEAFLVMARIKRALNFEAGFGCRCRDGLDHSNATCQRPGAPGLGNMTE